MQITLTRARGQYVAHSSYLGLESKGVTIREALVGFARALDSSRMQCAVSATRNADRAMALRAFFGDLG